MTRDLFRRYVWLIDTVRHGQKVTFTEVSDLWDNSPLNDDRSSLALRTFHNHREAIEILFGIRILCDRSTHHYYIPDDPSGVTDLKIWMLQTLSISHILKREASDVENRVLFDITPEKKFGLFIVIDAMKANRVLTFERRDNEISSTINFAVEPYCLRYINNSWHLLAKDTETGTLSIFDLQLLDNLRISSSKFRYPEDFSPRTYFANYFGLNTEKKEHPSEILVKVTSTERDAVIARPLHKSQKEVQRERNFSIFRYEFVPTADFIDYMIGHASSLELIAPADLRQEIHNRLQHLIGIYSKSAQETAIPRYQEETI